MVAEAEQAKQKELEAEVRNTLGNAVKGLNKKLEITATTKEMTDALVVLQQTFSGTKRSIMRYCFKSVSSIGCWKIKLSNQTKAFLALGLWFR